MNNLTNKPLTINTREIANMMGTEHSDILKKLEGTRNPDGSVKQIGIIPVLTEGNFPVSDYFIKSSYIDASGKENPCYDCTKLGCDFLANKFTGEKGILFTAAYVKRFHDLSEQVKAEQYNFPRSDVGEIASLMRAWLSMITKAKIPYQHGIAEMIKFMQSVGIPITDGVLHQEEHQLTQLSMDFTSTIKGA